jgi:hypothetical protein
MRCKDKVSVFLGYDVSSLGNWFPSFQDNIVISSWTIDDEANTLIWNIRTQHHITEEQKSQLHCSKTWCLQLWRFDNCWWVRKDFFVCLKVVFWTLPASTGENNEYLRVSDPFVEIWTGFLPNKNQFRVSVLVHCPSIICRTYSRLHMYYTRTSCN